MGSTDETTSEIMQQLVPEQTLEYFIERRGGNKRNYIFDYGKSRRCDHPNLRGIARGGIVYRCLDCNYTFHIPGAYQQPMHNEVIMAAFTMLVFSKEFGSDALGEVLRRPIGQHDGTEQKPVLPEGMSFTDVLALLEGIDVNETDGGVAQLYTMLEQVWVNPEQRKLREAENQRQERQLAGKRELSEEPEGTSVPVVSESGS
jgi:hypothetical protein